MDIKKIKLALMNEVEKLEDDASNFNLKHTAVLDIETILKQQIGNVNEDNYDDFIKIIITQIYEDISNQAKLDEITYDTLGLWITNEDGVIDNSIKISILDDIKQYGADDINPLYEFYDMTLAKVPN